MQAKDGKWFYGQSVKGGFIPVGACSPDELCPVCGKDFWMGRRSDEPACGKCGGRGLVPKDSPCPGHDTKEEAYSHQAEYELANATYQPETEEARGRSNQLHRCDAKGTDGARCSVFTCGYASTGPYSIHTLCPAHCNAEGLKPLVRVGERWQS